MPIYSPYDMAGLSVSGDLAGQPQGKRPQFFWNTKGRGVPRFADLVTTRVLEDTHTIELPLRTVIEQVVGTEWRVRPTVDNPTQAHWDACEQLDYWLRGHFNANRETFDHWIKQVTRDILSIDAGTIELVPEDSPEQYLAEMYARDGATMVKNPDEYGILPAPDSLIDAEAAYYQFSLPAGITNAYVDQSGNPRQGIPAHSELFQGAYNQLSAKFSYGIYNPIPFSRDQLVWMEESPRTWDTYGRGRVQTIQRVVELILNQDMSNLKYFAANEIPEGVLNLVEGDELEIERFRKYWVDNIKGKQHKMAIINGKLEWIKFRDTLKDLSFIESQEWYHKLTWMQFGLNQSEVGDLADVNRSTAEEQSIIVWRKTTVPLLKLEANYINGEIFPFREEYQAVNGEVEFSWDTSNPAVDALERRKQVEDLNNGLMTVNEIRLDRGLEKYRWGDWPTELTNTLARTQPEWFLEAIMGEEDVPDPLSPYSFSLGQGEAPYTKNDDALRNELEGSHPTQVKYMAALEKKLELLIMSRLEMLKSDVKEAWPEEGYKSVKRKILLVNVNSIIARFNIAAPMLRIILMSHAETVEDNMNFYKREMEREIKETVDLDDDMEPIANIKVQDTEALEILRQNAAARVITMEQQVKNKIKTTLVKVAEDGGNITMAIDALDNTIPEISRERATTIARTEVMSASRQSSQALSEASSLIVGKEWDATGDLRTRSWHAAMDGVIIPKHEHFIVPNTGDKKQPKDYPRETLIVGMDQPFNCRCDQRPKLAKDMPSDLKSFKKLYPEISFVRFTKRMREVLEEHGRDNEGLPDLLKRYVREGSRNKVHDTLGITKMTYYNWTKLFDRA